jgi:chromosome segregation ATPase
MARTHSVYTASPTRRDGSRDGSHDGSQYEMDLDALGLNSTFDSTRFEGSLNPPIDRIETSEVEGPEDFTMNMTYWMTADLPPSQVKSRKEAKGMSPQPRTDAYDDSPESDSAGPAARAHATSDEPEYSTAGSEHSMENEEKVRSFLSALPDADIDSALASSPLRMARRSLLQVPRSSPPKARSLQPTVEDGDTPRKPTQETVIHHPSPILRKSDYDADKQRFAELQARLEQQELISKTRVTELETLLSFTRSELESARNDNYKHKGRIASLEKSAGKQSTDLETRLQALEEAKQVADEEVESRGQALKQVQSELTKLKQSSQRDREQSESARLQEEMAELERAEDYTALQEELNWVQTRADSLEAQLEQATSEAKAAREESEKRETERTAAQDVDSTSHLESQLQSARFELECAQADIAAKNQLFQTNLDLNSQLRALRSELETSRTNFKPRKSSTGSLSATELAAKDREILHHIQNQEQLEHQLNTSQGRIEGLESTITTLRQQLAESHREAAKTRTNVERLEQELEDANDRLQDMRSEVDRRVSDMEKKLAKAKELRVEAETKLEELRSQHDDVVEGHTAMLEDVREKAEAAVRKAGALLVQERNEKKRVARELKQAQTEVEQLRVAGPANNKSEEDEDDDDKTRDSNKNDPTTASLQLKIQQQAAALASAKTALTSLRAENRTLKTSMPPPPPPPCTHDATIAHLTSQISSLEDKLATQAADHAATNAALDAQLASMLSRVVKERTRAVVGRRDGQWESKMAGVLAERETMGKVLLRQWGREEVGKEDKEDGTQGFRYQFVKR